MDESKINVSFACKGCGTQLSWPEDIGDAEIIACSKCGKVAGTFGELREAAMDAAKKKLDSMVNDIFKRR